MAVFDGKDAEQLGKLTKPKLQELCDQAGLKYAKSWAKPKLIAEMVSFKEQTSEEVARVICLIFQSVSKLVHPIH